MSNSISNDVATTALCLWEALLDSRAANLLNPELDAAWENEGAWALRLSVVQLAPKVDKLWDSLGDDLCDEIGAFDWEFCPLLIELMTDLHTLPSKAQIKAHMKSMKG